MKFALAPAKIPAPQSNFCLKKFCLTQKQQEVILAMRKHQCDEICLYGGGRSGKSILICIFLIQRAMLAPYSHHIILRNTAISARNSIFNDTLLTKIANFQQFKSIFDKAHVDQTRMIITFDNGSTIQIFGMNHIDKILGIECSSVYFNECSEIDYDKTKVPISRLAEKAQCFRNNGKQEYLKNMIFYDYNPLYTTHWTTKRFEKKIEPNSGRPLTKEIFVAKLNPIDNIQNIDKDYIKRQIENGGEKRFVLGEAEEEISGAIFTQQGIIKANNHQMHGWPSARLRQIMSRIVIGVDPAVTDGENSDNTGIVVAGTNGEDYFVLEDCSGKHSEEVVCGIVADLYKKWSANCVVVETNQGGSWIPNGLLMYCKARGLPEIPIKTVHAIFGKRTRAEPVSVAYTNGKVKHVQDFDCENRPQEHKLMKLEEEMLHFTGNKNEKSPDRMDAMVYAITLMMEDKPQFSTYSLLEGFFTN